jgi:hypothetical protein
MSNGRVMKAVVASLVTALVCVSVSGAHDASAPYVPACPHASYGADGNMGPLFCVVDNPIALTYFAKQGRHVFALGPNATPWAVAHALHLDYSTGPITCSIYQLAAWREHWSFGIPPTDQIPEARGMIANWCPTPRFNVG